MKKLSLLIASLFFVAAFSLHAQEASSDKISEISFEISEHPFGDITQGDKVKTVFEFTNTGTAPLVLTNVSTTCGCTAPSWPREAIAPGEKGEIAIQFNSAGKMGLQNKVITIYSNAKNNPERIKITANVLKATAGNK